MGKRALLFTSGSPYSRLVRVVLDELELDYEKREELTTPPAESRAESAPTLQVPVFWDGEVHLWESGLIVEYLLETYRPPGGESPPLATALANRIHADTYLDRMVEWAVAQSGVIGALVIMGEKMAVQGAFELVSLAPAEAPGPHA